MVLISDNTAPVTEVVYEIGTDEPAVAETWTRVSIPLSFFTSQGWDQAEFFQWKLDPFAQSVDNNSILYLDNIMFTVDEQLSTSEQSLAEFKAFPNPTSGNWTISSTSKIEDIVVFDILGKQVVTLSPNSNETTIDATALNPGMYLAKINSSKGSKTIKLIKD